MCMTFWLIPLFICLVVPLFVAIATILIYNTGLNLMECLGGVGIALGLICVVLSRYRDSVIKKKLEQLQQQQVDEMPQQQSKIKRDVELAILHSSERNSKKQKEGRVKEDEEEVQVVEELKKGDRLSLLRNEDIEDDREE